MRVRRKAVGTKGVNQTTEELADETINNLLTHRHFPTNKRLPLTATWVTNIQKMFFIGMTVLDKTRRVAIMAAMV